MTKFDDDVRATADNCNHFSMCKINFLGNGVCPAGKGNKFVAYYPEGRMELVHALDRGTIPVTERLVHIAETCTLCGICDLQCAYLTTNRIYKVMEALNRYVEDHLAAGRPVHVPERDATLTALQQIVGERWATSDPAILVSYSRDRGLIDPQVPSYVVMPHTTGEVSEVVKVLRANEVPYIARANGGNSQGMALGEGAIIDLMRMTKIEVDRRGWCATIDPGVTAFTLQKAAEAQGMVACVAEPSACVCGNILFSRLNSMFNHGYGMGGSLIVDAEFVDEQGRIFTMNDPNAPNLYIHHKEGPETLYFLDQRPQRICTSMTVKLFPRTDDEEMFIVPFSSLSQALELSRELGRRRIGVAVGVASVEYISMFLGLTQHGDEDLEDVLRNKFGIEYCVVLVGDCYAKQALLSMTDTYINQTIAEIIMQSIPKLAGDEGVELLAEVPGRRKPYEVLLNDEMVPLLELILEPSMDEMVADVDEDLQESFRELFQSPRFMDLVWLLKYRINSARIGRKHRYYPIMFWVSLDEIDKIDSLITRLCAIGDAHGVGSDFGFSNTIDFGKWAVVEFDFYYKDEELEQVRSACVDAYEVFNDLIDRNEMHLVLSSTVVFQGQCRTEVLMKRPGRQEEQ